MAIRHHDIFLGIYLRLRWFRVEFREEKSVFADHNTIEPGQPACRASGGITARIDMIKLTVYPWFSPFNTDWLPSQESFTSSSRYGLMDLTSGPATVAGLSDAICPQKWLQIVFFSSRHAATDPKTHAAAKYLDRANYMFVLMKPHTDNCGER